MELKQGQYVIGHMQEPGWYVGENEDSLVIETENNTGWKESSKIGDPGSYFNYKIKGSGKYLYDSAIEPHCGEGETLCNKCQESLGLGVNLKPGDTVTYKHPAASEWHSNNDGNGFYPGRFVKQEDGSTLIEVERGDGGTSRSDMDIPSSYEDHSSGYYVWSSEIKGDSGLQEPYPNPDSLQASTEEDIGEGTVTCDWSDVVKTAEVQLNRWYGMSYSDYMKRMLKDPLIDNYSSSNTHTFMESCKETLKKIPSTLKRVLDKDLQAQYKAGLINGDLALTSKGERILIEELQQEHKDLLTKRAEEIVAELEDEE